MQTADLITVKRMVHPVTGEPFSLHVYMCTESGKVFGIDSTHIEENAPVKAATPYGVFILRETEDGA